MSGRFITRSSSSSSCLVAAYTVLALKLCPHSSSVTERTLRVEKPCTYISAIAKSGAFSLR